MQHGFYDLLLTQELEKQCMGKETHTFSVEALSKEEFWHEFPTHVATEVLEYLKNMTIACKGTTYTLRCVHCSQLPDLSSI